MTELPQPAQTLAQHITEAVNEFIANEEAFTDNVQIRINIQTMEVAIADPEDDLPECDYYPVMDLVRASSDAPGKWVPDEEAINAVVADYFVVD